jgi:hypothetical protein
MVLLREVEIEVRNKDSVSSIQHTAFSIQSGTAGPQFFATTLDGLKAEC